MVAHSPLRQFSAFASFVLLALAGVLAPARAQVLDPTLWATDGEVFSTAVSNKRLFVGGNFHYVGPRTGGFAEVMPGTGLVRPSLPRVDGFVYAVASDSAGGWYIGGAFSSVAGVTRRNAAHVRADGSLSPWNPAPDSTVYCIHAQPEGLYLGGDFLTAGGEFTQKAALVNRTTGASLHWTPVPSGTVYAIVKRGTTIYLAGSFVEVGPLPVTRPGVAAVDDGGIPIGGFNANAPAGTVVRALVLQGNKLFVAGNLTTIGGQARTGVAALNPATGVATTWNAAPNGVVRALLAVGPRLYLGGDFAQVGGQSRICAAAVDTLTGALQSWNPVVSGGVTPGVYSLAEFQGRIFIGGKFTTVAGAPRARFAAVLGSGLLDAAVIAHTGGIVRAIACDGTRLGLGGELASVGGVVRDNVAALDLQTGGALDWNPRVTGGVVRSLSLGASNVYVGGSFSNVGDSTRRFLAAIDTATALATGWNPAPDSAVRVVLYHPLRTYVGGHFRNIGGAARNIVAAVSNTTGLALPFNAFLSRSVNGSTNNNNFMYVRSLAIQNTTLYIGGLFTRITSPALVVRNFVCSVDYTSGALNAWNPNMGASVNCIVPTASAIYLGGEFFFQFEQPRACVAALDPTTALDIATFNVHADSVVNALVLNGTTITMGGGFYNMTQHARNGLARGNTNTGLATLWDPRPDTRSVEALSVDPANEDIIAGGSFEKMGGRVARGLARFHVPASGALTLNLTEPADASTVPPGSTIKITWDATAPGSGIQSVDLRYVTGDAPTEQKTIAEGITGRGHYVWQLPAELSEGKVLGLILIARDWNGAQVVAATPNGILISATTAAGPPAAGAGFALAPVSPNPVRGGSRVSFSVPQRANVKLTVLDVQGRLLATLADGPFAPGRHELSLDTRSLPPGLCFVRMQAPGVERRQRVVVLR